MKTTSNAREFWTETINGAIAAMTDEDLNELADKFVEREGRVFILELAYLKPGEVNTRMDILGSSLLEKCEEMEKLVGGFDSTKRTTRRKPS